jgi:hypothetical protein
MFRLATLIAGFFGSIFAWIAGFFTAKVAASAVLGAVTLGIVMLLYVSLKAFTSGLVSHVDDETFRMVFWSIWPLNAEACLAACWGSDICVFLFKYRIKLLDLLAK